MGEKDARSEKPEKPKRLFAVGQAGEKFETNPPKDQKPKRSVRWRVSRDEKFSSRHPSVNLVYLRISIFGFQSFLTERYPFAMLDQSPVFR
jgi:hypothetical protein